MLNSKKSIRYRTGRNFSYRSANRYRNSYVCTGLTGENRVFGPVKKKPEKHTTKKEKKAKKMLSPPLSALQPSLFLLLAVLFQFYSLLLTPTSSSIFSFVLHVFLVGVLKIWLEGMPTSALLNAKVKKILPPPHFVCLLFYFGKSQNIVMFLKIRVIDLLKFLLIIQFFDKFI